MNEIEMCDIQPQFIEAEKSVIGSLLINGKLFYTVENVLKPESFYNVSHQYIYQAIRDIILEQNKEVDLVSVAHHLTTNGNKVKMDYLASLTDGIVTTANIFIHAKIVQEQYIKREIKKTSLIVVQEANDIKTDAFDLIAKISNNIDSITNSFSKRQELGADIWTHEVFDNLMNEVVVRDGIVTGISKLDRALFGGFQGANLVILAGRPSMGKTSIAIHMINKNPDKPCMIYSLDQTTAELGYRLVANKTRIEPKVFRQIEYPMTATTMKAIGDCLTELKRSNNVFINDESFDIDDLVIHAIGAAKRHKLKFIIIDYIQQLICRRFDRDTRNRQLEYISETLKRLSKILNIPVIALSQLNRGVEARVNRIPMLADLRESGAIEQAANIVIFMYNPAKYGFEQFPKGSSFQGQKTKERIEIMIAKQKDGVTANFLAMYLPEIYRFEDLEINQPYEQFADEPEPF